MKIRFLGACREVGRSAVAVSNSDRPVLLDYGVLITREVSFPLHIPTNSVQAIVLSHAHLDHSGMTPLFHVGGGLPVYGVEPTFSFSHLLISDFIKLNGYFLPYEFLDLENMMRSCINLEYGDPIKIGDLTVTLINAGHIPGSSQIVLETGGRRLLYTGDFNLSPTRLVPPADQTLYSDLDGIIIESTYADKDHPDRSETEKNFVQDCCEIVEGGGTVLVPAFGVGRSQEIVTLLFANNFRSPVFVDGMAREAISLMRKYPAALKDPDLFERSVERAEWIDGWGQRRRAVKTPSVIVSPAGMLKGGAAIFYLEEVTKSPANGVFLVSYQAEGTPGRLLLDEGKILLHGRTRKVLSKVSRYDFSSHGGQSELRSTLERLDKRTKVFVVHGSDDNCRGLRDWANRELGLDAVSPEQGETYDL